ncbi:hypothetical protein [Gordonia aurantiaca]
MARVVARQPRHLAGRVAGVPEWTILDDAEAGTDPPELTARNVRP